MTESVAIMIPSFMLLAMALLIFLARTPLSQNNMASILALVALIVAGGLYAIDVASYFEPIAPNQKVVNVNSENLGQESQSLEATALAKAAVWVCLGTGILFALMGIGKTESPMRNAILLVSIASAVFLAMSRDLFGLYIGVEMLGICTHALIRIDRASFALPQVHDRSTRKYVLHDLFASALLFFGFGLLMGLGGATDLKIIERVLSVTYSPGNTDFAIGSPSRLGVLAIMMIWGGLGAKIALVPMHLASLELPDLTTSWSLGVIATVIKCPLILVLWKVVSECLIGYESTSQLVGAVIALSTMTVGNVFAFRETRLRQLLMHLTVAHSGLLIMALAAGIGVTGEAGTGSLSAWSGLDGGQALMFHLLVYCLTITGLLGVLMFATQRHRDMHFVDDLSGFVRSEPWAAFLGVCFLLSLAGFPPFPGFWSKFSILTSALSVQLNTTPGVLPTPHPVFVCLCLAAIANLVISALVSLRLITVMIFNPPIAQHETSGGQSALAASMLAASISIGFGVLPGPIFWFLIDAVE